ncbi:MAG: PHB depolymerase family esterase [Actinomycetota bacterium]|nr:PHB depolymerase family esterase [Actinomycetota bacterium]
MNDQMQNGMAEATRLTQQGRLDEATAAIQRALGGTAPVASPARPGGSDEPIEVISHLMKRIPHGPTEGPRTSGWGAATQATPGPTLRSRGVQRPPGMATGRSASVVVPEGARFLERSYTNTAGTRSYKLYVPSGYEGQAVPLIVMLHGCTQDPDDFAAGTRMNALAEEHNFLVAYPAQAGNANMQRCWNWFEVAHQQHGRGEPSLIAGITSQVIDEYSVVEERVYVAGMSAGGAMAAIMGATYPDLYAAIGVHSGLAPGSAHDMPSAFTAMRQGGPGAARRGSPAGQGKEMVPTIVFHGDRDTTVHPRNGDNLLAHLAGGRNGAPGRVKTRQGQVPDGHAYTRTAYHDGEGRAVVERWTVSGLGHAWSGGSHPGSYTDPKGPDASAEMVRFFEQHRRR